MRIKFSGVIAMGVLAVGSLLALLALLAWALWVDARLLGAAGAGRPVLVALMAAVLAATAGAFALASGGLRRSAEARRELDAVNVALQAEVTARARALSLWERRWRSLTELSADAIVQCGPKLAIEYVNPTARRLLQQMGLAEPMGRSIGELFPGETNASMMRHLERLGEASGRMPYVMVSLMRIDGVALVVEVGAVSYEEEGRIRSQIVIHDLSELRSQETALRDQLRFIEQLVEAVPLPLSLRDADGRFVRVNRAFERAYDCGRAAILGRSLFDILPYADAQAMSREDVRAALAEEPIDYEVHGVRSGGGARDVLVRALAMRRDDGTLVGVVALETDVTTMRKKELELVTLNTELSTMSSRLIGAQEAERRHISRELHDHVGQILTALKMQLASLALRLPLNAAALAPARELADEALRHARNLTSSLHPHLLDDLGLEPALNWLLDRFVRPTGLEVELSCKLSPERGATAIELVAFRVVQESLTNVVRHAEAAKVRVTLQARDGELAIEVRDDGQGFEASQTWFGRQETVSLGVLGMRERVFDVAGDFTIDSAPGSGTSVRVVLPW